MTIHIHRSEGAGWTALQNTMLRDPALTLRARGLLVQLLSHEDGWQLSLKYSTSQCVDGKQGVTSAFSEIQAAGYATRVRHQEPSGRFRWDYHVSDRPIYLEAETSGSTAHGETGHGETMHGVTVHGEADPLEDSLVEDSLEKNTKEKNTDLAPAARAQDPIFEALFYLETGKVYTESSAKELTSSGRGALNKAAAEVRATGISPAELEGAIMSWPDLFPDAVCTANAVAKHLSRMRMASQGMVARGNGHDSADAVTAQVMARMKKNEEEGVSWVP